MKKIIHWFTIIFTIIIFSGCRMKEYPFMNDKEEIACIEIVMVNNTLDPIFLEITPIIAVEEKNKFLEEFSNIKVQTVFGYAYAIEEGSIAIKFQYINGDFELIGVSGPGRILYYTEEYYVVSDEETVIEKYKEKCGDLWREYYEMDKHYNMIAGTVSFDQERLQDLVDKYLDIVELA